MGDDPGAAAKVLALDGLRASCEVHGLAGPEIPDRCRVGTAVGPRRDDEYGRGRGQPGVNRFPGDVAANLSRLRVHAVVTASAPISAGAVAPPSAWVTAAATKPSNSGCGRSGRLLNSGWNWLATNHGWSLSSTISTSRPSGDWPESSMPAFSRASRYELRTSKRWRWRS